jgi:hypothetical protein
MPVSSDLPTADSRDADLKNGNIETAQTSSIEVRHK